MGPILVMKCLQEKVSLKHSGSQSHWHGGSQDQGLEKPPTSGLDGGNEEESTTSMTCRPPRRRFGQSWSGSQDMVVEA